MADEPISILGIASELADAADCYGRIRDVARPGCLGNKERALLTGEMLAHATKAAQHVARVVNGTRGIQVTYADRTDPVGATAAALAHGDPARGPLQLLAGSIRELQMRLEESAPDSTGTSSDSVGEEEDTGEAPCAEGLTEIGRLLCLISSRCEAVLGAL